MLGMHFIFSKTQKWFSFALNRVGSCCFLVWKMMWFRLALRHGSYYLWAFRICGSIVGWNIKLRSCFLLLIVMWMV